MSLELSDAEDEIILIKEEKIMFIIDSIIVISAIVVSSIFLIIELKGEVDPLDQVYVRTGVTSIIIWAVICLIGLIMLMYGGTLDRSTAKRRLMIKVGAIQAGVALLFSLIAGLMLSMGTW